MPKQTVRVEGAEQLASTLARFGRDVADMSADMLAAGRTVARVAAGRAPRRTGAMAGSVRTDAHGNTASVASRVPYAAVQNWGTGPRAGRRGPHNIRRSLWLTGALDDSESGIAADVTTSVKRKLNKVQGE